MVTYANLNWISIGVIIIKEYCNRDKLSQPFIDHRFNVCHCKLGKASFEVWELLSSTTELLLTYISLIWSWKAFITENQTSVYVTGTKISEKSVRLTRNYFMTAAISLNDAFSALTLLVGRQEGHPAYKKTEQCGTGLVICLERGADLHMAQWMPLPLLSLASVTSSLVLPFWYRPTRIIPDKGPLNVWAISLNAITNTMKRILMEYMPPPLSPSRHTKL